jgi:hypothetical protein
MRQAPLLLIWLVWGWAHAQEPLRQELPANFAAPELIKATVQPLLSPEGRFVILPDKGTVLVIDRPERVAAAAQALQQLQLPDPVLALSLGARTGGILPAPAPARSDPFENPVRSGLDFPVPTEFAPPRLFLQPNGSYVVIPATPTRFGRRSTGTTLQTQAFANADGSVSVNLSYENVQFAGFASYGSPVMPFGSATTLPMQPRVPRPTALGPFLKHGAVLVPIFETTRLSTSVAVYPERRGDVIGLQLVPQITVFDAPEKGSEQLYSFRDYRHKLDLNNRKPTSLRGFQNAPDAFNEAFFGDEENPSGKVEFVLKGRIIPGPPKAKP